MLCKQSCVSYPSMYSLCLTQTSFAAVAPTYSSLPSLLFASFLLHRFCSLFAPVSCTLLPFEHDLWKLETREPKSFFDITSSSMVLLSTTLPQLKSLHLSLHHRSNFFRTLSYLPTYKPSTRYQPYAAKTSSSKRHRVEKDYDAALIYSQNTSERWRLLLLLPLLLLHCCLLSCDGSIDSYATVV